MRPRKLIVFTRAPVVRVTCLPGPENDCAATLKAKLRTLNINPRSTVVFYKRLRCRDVDLERRLHLPRARESMRPGLRPRGRGEAKEHHDLVFTQFASLLGTR